MKVRPSQWLGIEDDPWSSYCLDNAVMTFGRALEAEMEKKASGAKTEIMKNARRHQVLCHWLDIDDSVRYKAPVVKTKG